SRRRPRPQRRGRRAGSAPERVCRGVRFGRASYIAAAGPRAPLVDEPHLPRQGLIDAHGAGGFRFAGMSHRGSLLCLPDGIWAWTIGEPAQITGDALSKVFALLTDLDFFIIGSGTAPWRPPGLLRAKFHEAHVALDSMTTGPAVRTYNVMLM